MKFGKTGRDVKKNKMAGRDFYEAQSEFPEERGCYYKTAQGTTIAIVFSLFLVVVLVVTPGAREDTVTKLREWGMLATVTATATPLALTATVQAASATWSAAVHIWQTNQAMGTFDNTNLHSVVGTLRANGVILIFATSTPVVPPTVTMSPIPAPTPIRYPPQATA